MASKLEAVFALIDRASGPGKKIADTFKAIDQAGGKLSGSPVGSVFDRLTEQARSAVPRVLAVAASLEVVQAAGSVLGKAASGIFSFAEMAINASEFRRHSVAALAALEGSKEAGEQAYQRLRAMADASGQSDEGLQQLYRKLRLVGYAGGEAEDAVAAVLDIKATAGEQGAGALAEAFAKIKATGKFGDLGDVMKGAGISEVELAKSLRSIKRFSRMTDKEIGDAMAAGQVTADEGVRALYDTISRVHNNGGALGTSAKDMLGGSVEGKIQTVKNAFRSLFEGFDPKPLVDALQTVSDTLKSPEGQKAAKVLLDALTDIVKKIVEFATPENITNAIKAFAAMADTVVTLSKALGGGVIGGFKELMGALGTSSSVEGSATALKSLGVVFNILGKIIGWTAAIYVWAIDRSVRTITWLVEAVKTGANWIVENFKYIWGAMAIFLAPITAVIGAVVLAVGAFVAAWVWLAKIVWGAIADVAIAIWGGLTAAWEYVSGFAKGLWDGFVGIGKAIIDGLWSGISGAWATLTGNTKNLFKDLPAEVKKQLGIKSPSTVFAEIGANVMAGMTVGIEREAGSTNDAMAAAAEDLGGSVRTRGTTGGGGGGGRVFKFEAPISIVVQGGDSPEATARAVASSLESKVVDIFERFAEELGTLDTSAEEPA